MYSGTTFHSKSGNVIGAHQRIDRIARRRLVTVISKSTFFPLSREIVHFEGKNGPDGIKRKSPGKDEPWHYIDPTKADESDPLIVMMMDHIENLGEALRTENRERAAFESAWLAHAVVDGLTPAHHYPLEEKISELRGGEGLETRTTKREKIVLPGKTRRHQLRNNWEFWGAKGVMTTHFGFELGVATTLASTSFDDLVLPKRLESLLVEKGFAAVFLTILNQINELDMYVEFSKYGWTRHLGRETREVLLPKIIEAVMIAWMAGVHKANRS